MARSATMKSMVRLAKNFRSFADLDAAYKGELAERRGGVKSKLFAKRK